MYQEVEDFEETVVNDRIRKKEASIRARRTQGSVSSSRSITSGYTGASGYSGGGTYYSRSNRSKLSKANSKSSRRKKYSRYGSIQEGDETKHNDSPTIVADDEDEEEDEDVSIVSTRNVLWKEHLLELIEEAVLHENSKTPLASPAKASPNLSSPNNNDALENILFGGSLFTPTRDKNPLTGNTSSTKTSTVVSLPPLTLTNTLSNIRDQIKRNGGRCS